MHLFQSIRSLPSVSGAETPRFLSTAGRNISPILGNSSGITVAYTLAWNTPIIRAQIPLRGLFSKIFAPEQKIVLRPKLFDSDERFAGLSTGLCRVTDGWFAVSVTEETGTDTAADEEYPRLKALRERFAQRSRLASGLR